jgi:hypothetical protein
MDSVIRAIISTVRCRATCIIVIYSTGHESFYLLQYARAE